MLHVCDACYSLKKGNDDVSIRSLRVKRLSRPWLDLGCHGKAVNCSEHERCKTVCVKSDIKLLILKTLMIFKFRFLGWFTGLSKATHMKSLIVWGWAVRGSIPCVSYIRHQTDYDLQDIVNDTHHLFGDIQVLVLVWILFSLLGVVFTKADAMCEYVTILAKTTEEAEVKNSQTAGAAWMRYAQVTPIFGSQKPFAVEGVTPIAKVLQFDMADGEPRLLVGTPTKSGGQITLLAERIFRIQTSEVDIYEKEMTAVHETLQGDKIQPVTSKRPADSMVQETPSKKFAPAFLAEWRRHLCFDVQLTCLARCSCLAGQILISKCCLQLRCPCLDWQRNHLRRRQTCFADEKMKSLRLLWPSVKWKHLFSHLISSMRSPDVVTQVHMACADIAHCWHDRTWQKKRRGQHGLPSSLVW